MTAVVWANVIAGLALAGTALGWFLNHRDVKEAQKLGERAAIAQERMAKALEDTQARAARDAPTARPAWRLIHHSGDLYQIENTGTGPAYQVDLGHHETLPVTERMPLPVVRVDPGDVIQFLAVRVLATTDDTITVMWTDEPDGAERRKWSRPLPPKK